MTIDSKNNTKDGMGSPDAFTDKLKYFKERRGLFCVIDYFTNNGISTAKGIFKDISDSGDMTVAHIHMHDMEWGFHMNQIKNYKFSKIKED